MEPDLTLLLRQAVDGRSQLCAVAYGLRTMVFGADWRDDEGRKVDMTRTCNRVPGHAGGHCDHSGCNHTLEHVDANQRTAPARS